MHCGTVIAIDQICNWYIQQFTVHTWRTWRTWQSGNSFTMAPVAVCVAISIPSNHTHIVCSALTEVRYSVAGFSCILTPHVTVHKHTEPKARWIIISPTDMKWRSINWSKSVVQHQIWREKSCTLKYSTSKNCQLQGIDEQFPWHINQ